MIQRATIADIAEVLQRHPWFGGLDILASDVHELAVGAPVFSPVGDRVWHFHGDPADLHVQQLDDPEVFRFSLLRDDAPHRTVGALAAAGAVAGGALAIAAGDRRAPADTVLGLLVGGVIGALVGASASRAPRIVLTMRYDPAEGRFRVYDGPYARWAKTRFGQQALAAG